MINKVPVPAAITAAIAAGSLYMVDPEPVDTKSDLEKQIEEVFPNNETVIDDNFVLNLPKPEKVKEVDFVVTDLDEEVKVKISEEIQKAIDEAVAGIKEEKPADDKPKYTLVNDVECGFKNRVKRTDPTPDYLVDKWNAMFQRSPPPVQEAMGGMLSRNIQLGAVENGVKNMAHHINEYSKRVAQLDTMLRQGTGIVSGSRGSHEQRKKQLRQRAGG